MKPKILIDTVSLLSQKTGIGRYTYEVTRVLRKNSNIEYNYFYGYYSNNLLETSQKSDIQNLKSIIVKIPLLKKIARKALTLSGRLFASKYDLYWQPNFIPNDGIKAKKIVTSVHDFSFIFYREFHPKERMEYFDNHFFQNLVRSDMLITGSNYSKNEILEQTSFNKEQIRVIYHGIDHKLFKVYEEPKVDFELPKKFILSVGSIEPRKNLLGLLKAYTLLDDKLKSEYQLVLVGFKGWENREIMELIKENEKSIYYLGFISDEELAQAYNLASLFVFPSFYEGFGLPPLEAMACGTPVICSNTSSLPEVGGDAVVYCNPNDSNDITQKIVMVLNDTKLQNEMIEKGLHQAKKFSWEKSAQEHLKVFEEVLTKGKNQK